jgi:hypothetical protein
VDESTTEEAATASFREAAYQAIWGETTTPPPDQQTTPGTISIADLQPEAPLESRAHPPAKTSAHPVPADFNRI